MWFVLAVGMFHVIFFNSVPGFELQEKYHVVLDLKLSAQKIERKLIMKDIERKNKKNCIVSRIFSQKNELTQL